MLDDSILGHPIFDSELEDEDSYYNIKKIMAEAGITFPVKMTFEPEKPIKVIRYDSSDETFWIDDLQFESLNNAYDHVDVQEFDTKFDPSVKNSSDYRGDFFSSSFKSDDLSMITTKSDKTNFNRILIGKGPEESNTLEYAQFFQFLRSAKRYLENQDDFVEAWHFITHHPAFWYRPAADRQPFLWSTDDGHHSVWQYPTRNDKGEIVVMLEHGSSVEPEHTMHYHDCRLDVWAPTFEEAYIDLAKKTHKFFSLDGEDRPDVPYQKTQLELDLEERLTEVKKDLNDE
jgi:hypothetical protein